MAKKVEKDPVDEAADIERRLRDTRDIINRMTAEPSPGTKAIMKKAAARKAPIKDAKAGGNGSAGTKGSKRSGTTRGLTADLLWIYKKIGGRQKLMEKIEVDRDLQKVFLRELLSLERRKTEMELKSTEAATKGRSGSAKSVFTIKGLYKDFAMPVNEPSESPEQRAEGPRMSMDDVPPELQTADDWDDQDDADQDVAEG